jgi:hypothetical protein
MDRLRCTHLCSQWKRSRQASTPACKLHIASEQLLHIKTLSLSKGVHAHDALLVKCERGPAFCCVSAVKVLTADLAKQTASDPSDSTTLVTYSSLGPLCPEGLSLVLVQPQLRT